MAGVPGFYETKEGLWNFVHTGRGILVPVKDRQGRIQGMQLRLDNVTKRKFRWIPSTELKSGCRAEGWIHMTGKPDLEYCRSLETGIITMNNEIIRKVNTLHDMMLEDEHIKAVVMGEKVVLPEEIKKTICEEAGRHAGRILDQLRELQVDLRANPPVFLGGGSMVLRKYIENSPLVMMADFIEEPRANAIGYQMLAQGMIQKKSGK